jgi:hypothetical protein
LNLIKDQITHSKSINSNKFEKKFTYKLKGNNLVKKNYSKFSNDDLSPKKSIKITKTMTKSPIIRLKKILLIIQKIKFHLMTVSYLKELS